MANGKKSFIMYTDYISTFEKLTDEEAGRLIKHILRYVNDKNPEPPDRLTEILFESIKMKLKIDLAEWEKTIEQKRIEGIIGNLKRWHPDIYKLYTSGNINFETAESMFNERKLSSNNRGLSGGMGADSAPIGSVAGEIAVTVTDSVIEEKEIHKEKEVLDKPKTWRNDFDIYKSEMKETYNTLIYDSDFIKQQEKFHPNVDIKLSLEKAITNFWGTEAGWKYKKKQKTQIIDWRATLINAIDKHKVYKPKYEQPQQTTWTPKLLT